MRLCVFAFPFNEWTLLLLLKPYRKNEIVLKTTPLS